MHKALRNVGAVALSALFLLGGLSACGSKTEGDKKSEDAGSLTIYASFPEIEVPTYVKAFQEDTGIKVNYTRLSAGEVLTKLQTEKNNPQSSIWYGGPSDTFVAAEKNGLLEAFSPAALSDVPDTYKDKKNTWAPVYVGALGFACNEDWFKKNNLPYPESWDDLLKPEFKGQISMAHPGSSGTAYTILATIIQKRGEEAGFEYMKKLNENVRQYTKSGAAPAQQVALGEAAVGICFSHDGLKPKEEGYPITLTFPKDGTGFEIGAVAIIKNGPKAEQENAKRFMEWAVSEKGQSHYGEAKAYRMPVNTKVQAPKGAVEVDKLAVIDYDDVWAGEHRKELIEKFTKLIASKDNLK